MKLLFVGSVFHQHIIYFSRSLKSLGFEIFAFDLSGQESKISDDSPFVKVWRKCSYPRLKLIDDISKVFGTLFRFAFIKDKIDVVQFHYLDIYYTLPLVVISKWKRFKISCFVYGSDFLRAGSFKKKYLKLVFKLCDSVVCDSIILNKKLQDFLPQNREKFSVLNFGSIVIDDLNSIVKDQDFNRSKNALRKNVMCGYNGNRAQNHLKIFQSLIDYIDKVHLIIPMTYGGDENYSKELGNYLDDKGFDYEILTDFIPNNKWEMLLINTDIFIHMQDSDSFSSALAEHLFLGNVVINATWLEYEELLSHNIYYKIASFDNLNIVFNNVLNRYNQEVENHKQNQEKVFKLKSLDYCCKNNWLPYFKTIGCL